MGNAIGRPGRGRESRIIPRSPWISVGIDERRPRRMWRTRIFPRSCWIRSAGAVTRTPWVVARGNVSKRPYRRRRTRTSPAFLDEDAIDTSDTAAGKRKRAPAEGAMDSDVPTQSIDKKSRMGELRLALGPDTEGEGTCATVAPGEEKIDPGEEKFGGWRGAGVVRVGCGKVQLYCGAGIDGR